jgi:hypothetical protein
MPDDDAQEMPAWLPRFQVGDRVRVRLSAECRQNWPTDNGHGDGHQGEEDGRPGVIDRLWPVTDHPDWGCQSHPYSVRYDQSFPSGLRQSHYWSGGWYAITELEPLTSESPPRGDGE